jgi:hypothetical protein
MIHIGIWILHRLEVLVMFTRDDTAEIVSSGEAQKIIRCVIAA